MPRITDLFAWVVADTDENDEGVPAFTAANGLMMPLMGADLERAESLRREAQRVAAITGKPVKLIHSTGIEVLETVTPA